EFLAVLGCACKRVRVFACWRGLKLCEQDIQRTDHTAKRSGQGQIGRLRARARDLKLFDAEEKGFRWALRRGRVRCEFFQDIGEIERIVRVDLNTYKRFGGADLPEDPGAAKKGRQLEIGKDLLPGNKRLPILVFDQQTVDSARQN